MKLYLDDERPTPQGWHRAYTAPEAIELLKTGQVTHLSLDHDLGPPEAGTGYDVCLWVEQQVFSQQYSQEYYYYDGPLGWFVPPVMTVHSPNSVESGRMESSIKSTYRHFKTS